MSTLLFQPGVFFPQALQFLIQMFVIDLLLLALSPVIFPDPGMQRVVIHPEVASGLRNGLIRLYRQFHRAFLEFGGILFHRGLPHRTHPLQCVMSLVSVCPEEYSHIKTALLLVWDNASWHVSQAVRAWLKAHNRHVTQAGGCRVVVYPLPVKSPWLNRIEPKWVQGKRAIAEPDRKLHVAELKHRICAYYDCELLEPIAQ